MTQTLSLPSNDAGYTLLELMIALTLLGFLSFLLFSGLKLGTRVWERSEDVTANGNRIRSIERLLTAQIRQIYPKPLSNSEIEFDGEPSSLRFLSSASDNGALQRVTILASADNERNALSEISSDELATVAGSLKPLLGPIVSLSFAYFGQEKDERQASWHRVWNHQAHLPSLIRVSANLADRALAFPSIVIAPRIDADESCVLYALTHDCQGR